MKKMMMMMQWEWVISLSASTIHIVAHPAHFILLSHILRIGPHTHKLIVFAQHTRDINLPHT
jgi:hypothetical protein